MAMPPSLLLLLICIAATLTTTHSSAADIAAICDKTVDRAFCIGFLNSTRAAKPSANLRVAGRIAIERSRRSAGENRRYIKYLAAQAASDDDDHRGRYKTCLAMYGNASKSISKAKAAFRAGDYDSANVYAGAARSYADTCDEELMGCYDEKVHEMHRLLFDVLDVVLVVTNMLLRRGF